MIPLNAPAAPQRSPFDPERQQRFDEAFDKAVAKYPPERRRAALLAALHIAQDLLGWLPEAAMAYVGFRLDVPPVRVREVATFYTMYRLKPTGRHHIEICNSVSCWAMGSEKLFESCEKKLGIRKGETTKDGQFSLGAPAPAVGSFDAAAAARGKVVFDGAGRCAQCHAGPSYTDAPMLHAAAETGMTTDEARRSATGKYRTTPLRGAWQHPPYFHDGSAATMADVVHHYDQVLALGLSDVQRADLAQYVLSL